MAFVSILKCLVKIGIIYTWKEKLTLNSLRKSPLFFFSCAISQDRIRIKHMVIGTHVHSQENPQLFRSFYPGPHFYHQAPQSSFPWQLYCMWVDSPTPLIAS